MNDDLRSRIAAARAVAVERLALAEAATPGPWEQNTHAMPGATIDEWYVWELVSPQEFGGYAVHPLNVIKARGASHARRECCWPPTAADAAHIAANDPSTVAAEQRRVIAGCDADLELLDFMNSDEADYSLLWDAAIDNLNARYGGDA